MEPLMARPGSPAGCENGRIRASGHEEEGRRVSIKLVPDIVGVVEPAEQQWRCSCKLIFRKAYHAVDRCFGCDTARDYSRRSWGIFHLNSRIRRLCTTLSESVTIKYFLIGYVCVNEILHLDAEAAHLPLQISDPVELILVALLLLEFVYDTIALGLWKGQRCYFRQPRCLFNFSVLVVAISDIIVAYLARCNPPPDLPQVSWYTSEVALFFSLARNLRVLRLFETETCKLVFSIFRKCLANLLALAGLVCILVFCYLIVYSHTYGYTQFNVCYTKMTRDTPTLQPPLSGSGAEDTSSVCKADSGFWEYDASQERLCRPDLPCREGTECRNIFLLPRDSKLCTAPELYELELKGWRAMYDTPLGDWGLTGFHDTFSALVSFLQCVTLEGWTEVMYRLADGDSTYRGVLIYLLHHSVVILGNLFLMNVVVAIMWESTVLETSRSRATDAKKGDLQMFEVLGVEWIMDPLPPAKDAVLIILLNSGDRADTYGFVNCIFFVCYCVDVVLQLIACGCREFLRDGFKVFDLGLAIVGGVEVVFSLAICGSFSSCSDAAIRGRSPGVKATAFVLSVLHSLRLFKLVRNFPALRLLVEVTADLVRNIFFFYALLIFQVYVFATFGFALFFDPNYGSYGWPLTVTKYCNFESIWQALLLVFGLLTGESWHVTMQELYSVYMGRFPGAPGSAVSSNVALASRGNVYIISVYIFFAVVTLCCFFYNVFEAVLIGQYVTARKVVFNSHIFRFIKLCRELGVEMPTRAAIDTSNLQRMYSLASPKIVGRRKAWRALSEFLRPRSLPNQEAPTFSNTSSGAAWMLQRLTQSISRASTLRRRSQRASANGSRPPERRPGGLRFRRDKQRAVAAHAVSFWRRGRRRESKRGPATESERPSPGQTRPSDATGGVLSGDCCQAQPAALRYPAGGLCGRQRNHGADDVEGLWAVNPGSDTHLASTRPDDAALSVHSTTDAAGDGAVDGPEGPLSLGESVCYLFTLTLICCYDAVARLVSSPFKWLNERIVSYDSDRPDAIVDFIRFILMEEGLEDASTASALPAPGVRRKREQSSVGGGDLGSQSTPTASLAFLRGGPVATLLRPLTSATAYGWALAALEVVSLLCLVVECMLTDNEQARNVFGVLEWIFAFLFLAESLLRVGAYGWCRGGCLALGSGASRAGFLVSLVSCVLLLINQTLFAAEWRSYACRFVWQLPLFRLVKVLHSFRSFHLFSLVQMEGVRIVVRSLLACTRSLVLLSAFLSLVFVMFALIFSRIMRVGYVPPDNPNEVLYTFQTFFEASIGVFVLATNEGWPLLLSRLLDRNPTQQVALSVLVFLFNSAVSIFGVKMCVGIIVDASRRKKARMEMEGSLLSATVHKWTEIEELLFNSALQYGDTMPDFTGVDSKRLAMARKKAAALITSGCFRMAAAVHTCLCCLLLFFYGSWYDMTLGPHRQGRRLELHTAIVCLSAFFFIEIGTRIFARGRLFFREALDILDVVLCCLLAGTFGVGVVLWMGWGWRVDALTSWLLSLRLFRIARFLYRQMPFFQTLFTTISRVMKSLLSVLTLLGLSIFFFAIWGVVLFSGAPVETYFNRHANFKMLPRAVMALIGSCTGEDWHMILQQLRMHYTATDQKLLRVTVVVFFISFIVLVFFILMDLFTTAVLDEYMDTVKDENLWKISCQKRVLIERWNPKNELSTNCKSLTDMIAFLRTIDQPMGIKHRFHPDEKRQKVLKYIAKYGLPVYAGVRVDLPDVVLNCAKRA